MGSTRKHVLELDVLRWIAAVFMIVNHAGYRLLGADDATTGLVGALVFIGSFAPVLFYFSTGFGVAMSVNATGRAPALGSTFVKAMLLVAADQLMFWRTGSAWGINFLAFIGLSSLLVSVIARSRRAVPICIAMAVGLLALRYGVGPRAFQASGGGSFWGWVCGVQGIQDLPYPPTPWLVYPLLGFALGRAYAPVHPDVAGRRNRWLGSGSASGLAMFAAAGALFVAGAIFFRWGTVSVAYFVLSLGVLAAVGVVSLALTAASARVAARCSLQGVASFAVIPIHYGVLELAATASGRAISWPAFLMALVPICVVSLWLSSRFATAVTAGIAGAGATPAAAWLGGAALVS
ncbi:MAG TPA: heparan-alpha-glucosaminide N-acetyltransferase domain-containing protein, partial [Burkholderiaceae bacterium]